MAAPGWIELFVLRLEAIGLPYMVAGSVASMIYGEPRLTLDVDLVVELDVERAEEIVDAFPETEFYRPPLEVVRKLEFWREGGSEKHLRDVRGMLAADLALDRSCLDAELRRRGLEEAWRRVAESR